MKAIVKQACVRGAIKVASVSPPPPPTGDEVMIKIHSAALCGSDLHAYEFIPSYRSFIKIPVVLGHEGSGVVQAVGPEVRSFAPGDRVMSEAHFYCGECHLCRAGKSNWCEHKILLGLTTDGVMREYTLIKERYLHTVPAALSFAEAASAQAVSVSVHGVLGRINIKPGDLVIVSGIGIIGLAAAQLARRCGATVAITGLDADEKKRMPVARSMGFDVINCQRENVYETLVSKYGRKADFAIECSGAESAVSAAVESVTKGGTILQLGIPQRDMTFPMTRLIRLEINLVTSYASGWADYEKALSLLAARALDITPILSVYPAEQAEKAFLDGLSKMAVKPVLQFAPDTL